MLSSPCLLSLLPSCCALLLRAQLHLLLLVLEGTGENVLLHCLALWSLDSNICVNFSHHYLHQSYLNSEPHQCKVNTELMKSSWVYVWL